MSGFAGRVVTRIQDQDDFEGTLLQGRFLRHYPGVDYDFTLADFIDTGNTDPIFLINHQFTNATFPSLSANHPDYSALRLVHTNLADTTNISSPFDLIWTGIRSELVYGSATVNARGTEHASTFTLDVQGSGSSSNELALYMGWMRAKPASGTAANGVASMWFTDWSLHGNIGSQSSLLNGITMLVNSYDAAEPSRGRSACAWFVTKPGQGAGTEDGHDVAPTWPLNVMVGIMGWSGTEDEVTKRRGADTALAIGEWGSGWGLVQDDEESWWGDGIAVRGGELSALKINDPHANASSNYVGSAILFNTIISGRQWNWQFDAVGTAAEAPTVGAIRLHGTNGSTAGRVQWGSTNAPALYRSANNVIRWEGAGIIAPAAIASSTTSTAHLYVRHDTNAELAVFESAAATASVFLKLGDGSGPTSAALRIYPQVAATALNTLVGTGGMILRGSYWTGSASANRDVQWALRMLTTAPTFALVATINNADQFWIGETGITTVGIIPQSLGRFNVMIEDSVTAAATVMEQFNHRSSGTPAAGFGSETRWRLESTTTEDQEAASVAVTWATATHASRKARVTWSVYDTAVREALRMEADGANALLGIGGAVVAATRATLYTGADANVGLAVQANSGTQSANWQEWRNSSGVMQSCINATGGGQFSGAYVETSTTLGVHLGVVSGSARMMFCDGTAAENWAIDNFLGAFRWTTPGRLRLDATLDGSSNMTFGVYGQLLIGATDANSMGALIRGSVGQVADLTDWQDSATNINAYVSNIGAGGFKPRDTATNAITTALSLGHNTSGTPAAGFGNELRFLLESSTTEDRDAAGFSVEWATATDASRKALFRLNVYDTAVREVLSGEASGTAAMIGFLGAARVVRQTGASAAGIAAITDASAKAAITALQAALAAYGLVTSPA